MFIYEWLLCSSSVCCECRQLQCFRQNRHRFLSLTLKLLIRILHTALKSPSISLTHPPFLYLFIYFFLPCWLLFFFPLLLSYTLEENAQSRGVNCWSATMTVWAAYTALHTHWHLATHVLRLPALDNGTYMCTHMLNSSVASNDLMWNRSHLFRIPRILQILQLRHCLKSL